MAFNPEILKRIFDGNYSRNDYLAIKSILEKPEEKNQTESVEEKKPETDTNKGPTITPIPTPIPPSPIQNN